METIANVERVETTDAEALLNMCESATKRLYSHQEIYGSFCSIQEYINCPPDEVFAYLSQTTSLLEWTYSLRDMKKINDDGLFLFVDKIGGVTKCFCKTETNPQARTVDYYCAWDQSDELWMIYFMRVIPAQDVLNKPGSLVLWTNCCHPNYKNNPFPEQSPENRKVWIGEGWDFFYAGHSLEMKNLKHILEYRHKHGISTTDLSHLNV